MSSARLGLAALVLSSGCFDITAPVCEGTWSVAPAEDAPSSTQQRVVAQVLPVEADAIDILFVIDDSLSMADEQAQLGIWSSELFDVLADDGELPDLHIGVISSSVAIAGSEERCAAGNGTFHVGRAALTKGRYISDVAGPEGRMKNYTGTLKDTFAKMALVGDGGCGFEQPFAATRLALTAPMDGFLRPEALLLVVFVTDEDDCSATNSFVFSDPYADTCSPLGPSTSYRCFEHGVTCYDGKGSRSLGDRHNCVPNESSPYLAHVADVATFLKGLKANPAQVVVAGIYGKPNRVVAIPDERIEQYTTPRLANVCGRGGMEGTGATPAIRMNALLAEFGGRATHSSICEDELAWAMRDMGLVTRAAATRSHCLRGSVADRDKAIAGIQPTCRVVATRNLGTAREERTELARCDVAGPGERCFSIELAPERCAETQSRLAVRAATDNETLTVTCDAEVEVSDAALELSARTDPARHP